MKKRGTKEKLGRTLELAMELVIVGIVVGVITIIIGSMVCLVISLLIEVEFSKLFIGSRGLLGLVGIGMFVWVVWGIRLMGDKV